MEALKITDETFDSHHDFKTEDGEIMEAKADKAAERAASAIRTDESGLLKSIKSVYLAEGIHHTIDEDDLEDLPRRFEAGSVKSRFSWFGTLCMAGIGMFVEAYIIITTGQVKSIWHAAYPTCWQPTHEAKCPMNIECCGLFPDTPVDDATGFCGAMIGDSNATGTFEFSSMCDATTYEYQDSFLCNQNILNAISYTEFAGLMLGMISFGVIADLIGVNNAGILTALLSLMGVIVMTFMTSEDLTTQFLVYAIFFGIFGLGVGGEYPLTAAGAAAHHSDTVEEAALDNSDERRMRVSRDKVRTARRGETIGMVFAMQGIGAVVGSAFLMVLIYFSDQGYTVCDQNVDPGANSEGVSADALNTVWRGFLFIGLIFVMMTLLYRWLIVEESEEGAKKLQERKQKRGTASKLTLGTIFSFYGPRVIATGGAWFLWDIAFYGLKLFSGPIFAAINPSGGLMVNNGYLLINNLLALIGYYGCSMIIDHPRIGRVKVQGLFFTLVSIVFLTMSFLFESLSPAALIALYFLSSILGQFVNVTTYVMAAETYPAELRGTLHGLSAFMGKSGALVATIVFGYVTTETIFLICGITGLIGAVLTALFSVDMTHVSLSEHDAQLELYLAGRLDEYKGRLNKPSHLSLFERMTGRHGEYDPDWASKLVDREKSSKNEIETSMDS